MKPELKALAEELLVETALFYKSSNRSVNGVMCFYNGPDGKRCAAGRLMTEDGLKKVGKSGAIIGLIIERYGIDIFQEKWRPLADSGFIRFIQMLHDETCYWDDDGINESGMKDVFDIIDVFGLDPSITRKINEEIKKRAIPSS